MSTEGYHKATLRVTQTTEITSPFDTKSYVDALYGNTIQTKSAPNAEYEWYVPSPSLNCWGGCCSDSDMTGLNVCITITSPDTTTIRDDVKPICGHSNLLYYTLNPL